MRKNVVALLAFVGFGISGYGGNGGGGSDNSVGSSGRSRGRGAVYACATDDSGGFLAVNEVSNPVHTGGGIVCDVDAGIQVSNRVGEEADVIFLTAFTFTNGAQCNTAYAGVLEKQG